MTPRVLHLADKLSLPADEAVTQKYGFIGRSGSGKSYAAMRLAELFLSAGAQIIALDWVGIWWSLRLAATGKDQRTLELIEGKSELRASEEFFG